MYDMHIFLLPYQYLSAYDIHCKKGVAVSKVADFNICLRFRNAVLSDGPGFTSTEKQDMQWENLGTQERGCKCGFMTFYTLEV